MEDNLFFLAWKLFNFDNLSVVSEARNSQDTFVENYYKWKLTDFTKMDL